MAKKTNDWIVATLNNPDYTSQDFHVLAGMNLDNTQMLSEEQYKKSNFILNNDAFKDANGNFSEQKFDDFYRQ